MTRRNELQGVAKAIIEQTRTPLERLNLEHEKLNELLDLGSINQETFGRAMEQAAEGYEAAMKKMSSAVESFVDRANETLIPIHRHMGPNHDSDSSGWGPAPGTLQPSLR